MSPDREGKREVTGKWEMGSGVGWAKVEKGRGGGGGGGGGENLEKGGGDRQYRGSLHKMGYHLSANFVKRLSLKSFHSPHPLQPFLKNLIPLFEGGGGGDLNYVLRSVWLNG